MRWLRKLMRWPIKVVRNFIETIFAFLLFIFVAIICNPIAWIGIAILTAYVIFLRKTV